MEFFPDKIFVRLRNRGTGAYLYADEDGVGVSVSTRRESLNTAWAVNLVNRLGGTYILLRAAAYGRYLVHSADSAPPGQHGNRATQTYHYEDLLLHALWTSSRAPAGLQGNVFLRNPGSTGRLRANGRYIARNRGVTVDSAYRGTMTLWTVEVILPRPEPPILCQGPGGSGSLFRCLRTAPIGEGSIMTRFNLRNQRNLSNITVCVRADSHGLLMDLRLQCQARELYLRADEDGAGAGVSLSPLRATWRVHRVVHEGNTYVLLLQPQGAAYGQYIALSLQLAPSGHDDDEQGNVLWQVARVGGGQDPYFILHHASGPVLRTMNLDGESAQSANELVEAVPCSEDSPAPPLAPVLSSDPQQRRATPTNIARWRGIVGELAHREVGLSRRRNRAIVSVIVPRAYRGMVPRSITLRLRSTDAEMLELADQSNLRGRHPRDN